MKILLTILDGLGDRPVSQFNDETPLEKAHTPNFDYLAEKGACGMVKSFKFPEENFPTSEGTHVAMFGYEDKFLGRGPYEAAGVGVKVQKNDIALRINFATVVPGKDSNNGKRLKILDRRAGRVSNTAPFTKALSGIKIKGVKFIVKKAYGHRGILIMKGEGISSEITDSDPHMDKSFPRKIKSKNGKKDEKFTAGVLNEFLKKSYKILQNHPVNKKRRFKGLPPANYILTRGAGRFKKIKPFKKKYGLKACCIAGGTSYKGIAKILGMKVIKLKEATGSTDTNLKEKFTAAEKNLKKYDFVFLHIKAVDTLGHDGDCEGKKEFIEKIDKELNIVKDKKDTLFVVTGDHSTPCDEREHSIDSLPILMSGKKDFKDSVKRFSEKHCREGKLGRIKQVDLMENILKVAKE